MSTIDTHAASTTAARTLPPGPRIPKALQGLAFAFIRRRFMHEMAHRYGDAFSLHVPVYGPIVVAANGQAHAVPQPASSETIISLISASSGSTLDVKTCPSGS